MVVYIDTRAMDVRMIVRVEVRFGGKDAGDGDEGEDENWVRYVKLNASELASNV